MVGLHCLILQALIITQKALKNRDVIFQALKEIIKND